MFAISSLIIRMNGEDVNRIFALYSLWTPATADQNFQPNSLTRHPFAGKSNRMLWPVRVRQAGFSRPALLLEYFRLWRPVLAVQRCEELNRLSLPGIAVALLPGCLGCVRRH